MNANVTARMRALGITEPDPDSELHRAIADVFNRLGNAPEDKVTIALLWCFQAELERQIDLYARSKTEFERVEGAGVIRYRLQGEKSAEVAKMKAAAEDEGVYLAHLEYRKAEQMIASAKRAQDILQASLDAWQTNQANARKQDSFIASGATS